MINIRLSLPDGTKLFRDFESVPSVGHRVIFNDTYYIICQIIWTQDLEDIKKSYYPALILNRDYLS